MSRPLASSRTPLPGKLGAGTSPTSHASASSDAGHSSISLPPFAASGGKLFYMCVPGPRRNRAAFRLIHWPTRRFMDAVFDEKYLERIILEDDVTDTRVDALAPTAESGGASAIPTPSTLTSRTSSSTLSTSTSLTSSSATQALTRLPPMKLPPARALNASRARLYTTTDDPRYSVSSYGPRKCPGEHVRVVKDNAGDPRSYAEAMAYSDAA